MTLFKTSLIKRRSLRIIAEGDVKKVHVPIHQNYGMSIQMNVLFAIPALVINDHNGHVYEL